MLLPEIQNPRGVIEAFVQGARAPAETEEAQAPAETEGATLEEASRPQLTVIEGGLKAAEQASAPRLDQLPTPGGIALLLLLIGFILFAIQKTGSGQTRMQLMWQALLGNASLKPSGASAQNQSYSTGGDASWWLMSQPGALV